MMDLDTIVDTIEEQERSYSYQANIRSMGKEEKDGLDELREIDKHTLQGRCIKQLDRIKSRAKTKGIDFDLDFEWLYPIWKKGLCQKTGIPFVFTEYQEGRKKTLWHAYQPSVDRIDPNGGYTKDNCVVTLWIYNMIKGDKPEEVVDTFCRDYLKARANRSTEEYLADKDEQLNNDEDVNHFSRMYLIASAAKALETKE